VVSGNCGYENKNLLEGFIIEQTAPMQLSYLNERGMINFNLDSNHKLNVKLISSLNVQEINEDYIICTDAWDEIRGLPTIFSLFFSLLLLPFLLFLFVILVMMIFDSWDSFFSEFIIFLIFLISCVGGGYFLYKIFTISFKREIFGYTHYPLIFNRKKQELHYFEPYRKEWISAPWKDYNFSITMNEDRDYIVNASILDYNRVVQKGIIFPFRLNNKDLVVGHWEFFRRYMAGESLEKLTPFILIFAPNRSRKETASEIWGRIKLLRFSTINYLTNEIMLPSNFNLNLIFFGIPQFLARRLCVKTSKIPNISKDFLE
jgi:hypothetical protein